MRCVRSLKASPKQISQSFGSLRNGLAVDSEGKHTPVDPTLLWDEKSEKTFFLSSITSWRTNECFDLDVCSHKLI